MTDCCELLGNDTMKEKCKTTENFKPLVRKKIFASCLLEKLIKHFSEDEKTIVRQFIRIKRTTFDPILLDTLINKLHKLHQLFRTQFSLRTQFSCKGVKDEQGNIVHPYELKKPFLKKDYEKYLYQLFEIPPTNIINKSETYNKDSIIPDEEKKWFDSNNILHIKIHHITSFKDLNRILDSIYINGEKVVENDKNLKNNIEKLINKLSIFDKEGSNRILNILNSISEQPVENLKKNIQFNDKSLFMLVLKIITERSLHSTCEF